MIGNKLKTRRKSLNITLSELSCRTGLSVSYLSNIERNETSPTLDNLNVICTALEFDMLEMVKASMRFNPVVRVEDRKPIYVETHRTIYELASDSNQNLRASIMTLAPDYFGEEISFGHNVDEINIIAKRSAWFALDDQEYILNEGDAIYIRANCPHRFKKTSDSECVIYCVKEGNKF